MQITGELWAFRGMVNDAVARLAEILTVERLGEAMSAWSPEELFGPMTSKQWARWGRDLLGALTWLTLGVSNRASGVGLHVRVMRINPETDQEAECLLDECVGSRACDWEFDNGAFVVSSDSDNLEVRLSLKEE